MPLPHRPRRVPVWHRGTGTRPLRSYRRDTHQSPEPAYGTPYRTTPPIDVGATALAGPPESPAGRPTPTGIARSPVPGRAPPTWPFPARQRKHRCPELPGRQGGQFVGVRIGGPAGQRTASPAAPHRTEAFGDRRRPCRRAAVARVGQPSPGAPSPPATVSAPAPSNAASPKPAPATGRKLDFAGYHQPLRERQIGVG